MSLSSIDDTEEMILNENFGNEYGKLRRFRINYNNEQGFSNIEGCVYFPAECPDVYERLDKICTILKEAFDNDKRHEAYSREG
jgi:hypothetical protein